MIKKMRLTATVAMFLCLWCQNLLGDSGEQSQPTFRVDKNGVVYIGDKRISSKSGIGVPEELLSKQKSIPTPRYGGDRYVWHPLLHLGVLLEKRNAPQSNGMDIIFPAYPSQDFPNLSYTGSIIIDQLKISFTDLSKLNKPNIEGLFKNKMPVSWLDGNTLTLTLGRTTVFIVFDDTGSTRHITVNVPNSGNP